MEPRRTTSGIVSRGTSRSGRGPTGEGRGGGHRPVRPAASRAGCRCPVASDRASLLWLASDQYSPVTGSVIYVNRPSLPMFGSPGRRERQGVDAPGPRCRRCCPPGRSWVGRLCHPTGLAPRPCGRRRRGAVACHDFDDEGSGAFRATRPLGKGSGSTGRTSLAVERARRRRPDRERAADWATKSVPRHGCRGIDRSSTGRGRGPPWGLPGVLDGSNVRHTQSS
jgi:hypothetical protein